MTGRKLRLAAASVLLVGWLGWLGYTAWAKYRGRVVSRSQGAAATLAVVARVPGGDGPQVVEVIEVLSGAKPDGPLTVANLSDAVGYEGAGEYLLLLTKVRADTYGVVGPLRTPGYDAVGVPTVYRWSPAVEAQARARFR